MTESNVVNLPKAEPKTDHQDRIHVNVRAAIGDGREMSLTTTYQPGEDPNSLLDQMNDIVNRQRARAELPGMDAEIALHREKMAQYERDMDAAEGHHQKELQVLLDLKAAAEGRYTEEFDGLRSAFEERRPSGEFDPDKPQHKAKLAPLMRGVDEALAAIKEKQATKEQAIKDRAVNLKRFEAALQEFLAKRQRMVDLIG